MENHSPWLKKTKPNAIKTIKNQIEQEKLEELIIGENKHLIPLNQYNALNELIKVEVGESI